MTTHGTGSPDSAAAIANGLYFVIQASGTPPAPTDPAWATTTVYDDVGVNDHTTYKQSTGAVSPTNYVFAMYYIASTPSWGTYTASLGYTESAVVVILYWNGSAWATWDTEALLDQLGGSLVWADISKNPTPQNSVAVCIGIRDSGFVGPFDARIGDFRPETGG